MFSAKVYPDPDALSEVSAKSYMPDAVPLPTGNELMSTPIYPGGVTRQQKEIEYVVDSIETRLYRLGLDEAFSVRKWVIFSVCFAFLLGGVTLILRGLRLTFFFDKFDNEPLNIPALAFGGLFCLPIFYWFYYIFFPNKEEKKKRKRIRIARRDRRKATLFNQLADEAKRATEPPPRRIRVLAHIRKHDYPIVATWMGQLTAAIEAQCGLAVERQLLRLNGNDLEIHLDKKLDEFYGMDNGDRIYVYNRGGFTTQNSPLKQARTMMNSEANRGNSSSGNSTDRRNSSASSKLRGMMNRLSFRSDDFDEEEAMGGGFNDAKLDSNDAVMFDSFKSGLGSTRFSTNSGSNAASPAAATGSSSLMRSSFNNGDSSFGDSSKKTSWKQKDRSSIESAGSNGGSPLKSALSDNNNSSNRKKESIGDSTKKGARVSFRHS